MATTRWPLDTLPGSGANFPQDGAANGWNLTNTSYNSLGPAGYVGGNSLRLGTGNRTQYTQVLSWSGLSLAGNIYLDFLFKPETGFGGNVIIFSSLYQGFAASNDHSLISYDNGNQRLQYGLWTEADNWTSHLQDITATYGAPINSWCRIKVFYSGATSRRINTVEVFTSGDLLRSSSPDYMLTTNAAYTLYNGSGQMRVDHVATDGYTAWTALYDDFMVDNASAPVRSSAIAVSMLSSGINSTATVGTPTAELNIIPVSMAGQGIDSSAVVGTPNVPVSIVIPGIGSTTAFGDLRLPSGWPVLTETLVRSTVDVLDQPPVEGIQERTLYDESTRWSSLGSPTTKYPNVMPDGPSGTGDMSILDYSVEVTQRSGSASFSQAHTIAVVGAKWRPGLVENTQTHTLSATGRKGGTGAATWSQSGSVQVIGRHGGTGTVGITQVHSISVGTNFKTGSVSFTESSPTVAATGRKQARGTSAYSQSHSIALLGDANYPIVITQTHSLAIAGTKHGAGGTTFTQAHSLAIGFTISQSTTVTMRRGLEVVTLPRALVIHGFD